MEISGQVPNICFHFGKKFYYQLGLSRYTHHTVLISSHFSSNLTMDILGLPLTFSHSQDHSGVSWEQRVNLEVSNLCVSLSLFVVSSPPGKGEILGQECVTQTCLQEPPRGPGQVGT